MIESHFDSPQEFAKPEMIQPVGETHAQKLLPKPQIPGFSGDHLKKQISSRSGKSLRSPPEHGLNVTLKAAGLPKSTYYYHPNEKVDYEEKYSYLKPKLDEIIDEHSGYARDKIKTELEENHG